MARHQGDDGGQGRQAAEQDQRTRICAAGVTQQAGGDRAGRLGQDLQRLAALARGRAREPKERVLSAIEAVVQLLFWPAAADDYTVPRSFWDTELGRMMALAKFRAFDASELVSIGNAAQQLGVTRPTIYRWMDDRTLNYVRDDMSGRTFVVRRDIENLKRVAAELSASPV